MEIDYTKRFLKNYERRIAVNPKLDRRFKERITIFLENPRQPMLQDHELSGNYTGFRAFSVTGDIRVVYRIFGEIVELYDIGSHNQVY